MAMELQRISYTDNWVKKKGVKTRPSNSPGIVDLHCIKEIGPTIPCAKKEFTKLPMVMVPLSYALRVARSTDFYS